MPLAFPPRSRPHLVVGKRFARSALKLPKAAAQGLGYTALSPGAIAQLGERLDRTQEVAGSSPASSISRNRLWRCLSGSAEFLTENLSGRDWRGWRWPVRAAHSSGPHTVSLERLQCRTIDPLSVPELTPVAWIAVLCNVKVPVVW